MSWTPRDDANGSYKRYIFFDSLETYDKTTADEATAYLTNFPHSVNNDTKSEAQRQTEQYKNYMENYIKTLERLARKEQENEIKYVEGLKNKVNFPIENYYTENRFDYKKFIAALQLVHKDLEQVRSTVKTNKHNMKVISDFMESQKKDISKNMESGEKSMYDKLTDAYIFCYKNYTRDMSNVVSSQLQASYADQINKKMQEIFTSLGNNPKVVGKLMKYIRALNPETNILDALRGWVIEYIQEELNNDKNINDIAFNPQEILKATEKTKGILERSLKNQYTSVLSDATSVVEEILDTALNKNENIANMLLEDSNAFNTLTVLMESLNISKETRDMFYTRLVSKDSGLKDRINNIQNNSNLDPKSRRYAVAGMKGNYTRTLGGLIRETLGVERGLSKEQREKIITQIISIYETQFRRKNKNVATFYANKLKLTSSSASSIAELVASPNFERFLQENIHNIFIPGKKIQYKADLTFNFTGTQLSLDELKPLWPNADISNIYNEVEDAAKTHGERFLKEYKKRAGGATSIAEASNAYIETVKKTIEAKNKLLEAVDDESKQLINEFFNNNLNGSISVKEYRYYNNEKGFHMGSLGGQGKVVSAVPNIIKMLDLGGISELDADVIIDALLNSFPSSLIGTDYVEDIKNLLIGGAAMMLFDDGFANAEHYLDVMKEQIDMPNTQSSPVGGSLHLLYLLIVQP